MALLDRSFHLDSTPDRRVTQDMSYTPFHLRKQIHPLGRVVEN